MLPRHYGDAALAGSGYLLRHLAIFGKEGQGVPVKKPGDSEEKERNDDKYEKTDLVDGLTAGEIQVSVKDALKRNSEIPLAHRCTHKVAIMQLKRTNTDQIWTRIIYVSKKVEPKADENVAACEETGVIKRATEACKNAFPLLCVPKQAAFVNKFDFGLHLDLRQLNHRLPDVEYPLPKIQDITAQVGSLSDPSVTYSTVDIRDSYFRFPIPATR